MTRCRHNSIRLPFIASLLLAMFLGGFLAVNDGRESSFADRSPAEISPLTGKQSSSDDFSDLLDLLIDSPLGDFPAVHESENRSLRLAERIQSVSTNSAKTFKRSGHPFPIHWDSSFDEISRPGKSLILFPVTPTVSKPIFLILCLFRN